MLLIIISNFSSSQTVTKQEKFTGFSISPKYGYDFVSKDLIPIFLGVKINYFKSQYVLSVSYYYEEEFNFSVSPDENYNYGNLTFGKYNDFKNIRLQYQGGIGAIWGETRGEFLKVTNDFLFSTKYYEKINYVNINIPLRVGFRFIPFRFFAIGIDLNADMNVMKPVFATLFCLEFGILRKN